ncbi:MAG: hypothetical protein WHS44_02770 [Fimbriimonadales bacterium]|nr:MAG: hypothetical protein KatS3mg018_1982 [Fimbriimonadales bacterium]
MIPFTDEEIQLVERFAAATRQYPHLRLAFIQALQMEQLFAIPEQLESLKQVVLELAAQYKQQQEQLNRIERTAERALETAERALAAAERAQAAAERASETAERALAAAERASETAERAQAAAERASETAERAQAAAERASETAERANETAERALQVATETREVVHDVQARLTRVEADVADLKGMSMELLARKHLPSVLGKLARKIHVYEPDEFYRLMEDTDKLSADDLVEVASADGFAHGHLRSNGEPRWFVVEASWGIGMRDVERAAKRAAILTQHVAPAVGVVLGKRITPDARRYAQTHGVLIVLNGAPRNPEAVG